MGTKPVQPEPIDLEIAKILSKLREEKGMSERELSEKSNQAKSATHRVLVGERPATVGRLEKYASALETRLSVIVKEAEEALRKSRLSIVSNDFWQEEGLMLDGVPYAAHEADGNEEIEQNPYTT